MKKKLLSLLLAGIMVLTLLPAAALAAGDSPFADVQEADWFYSDVLYAYERGLTTGTGNGLFSPAAKLTRAEMMTLLARVSGADTTAGEGEAWYQPGLDWAVAEGVSDGTNPSGLITREQMITMLWRVVGKPVGEADLSSFADAGEISSWAESAVNWAVDAGLVNGTGAGLNPLGDASRAEVVAVISRFYARVDAGELPMVTIITKLEGNGMNSTAVDVTSPENAKYFDDNGVNGVVAAGKFSINGFAIPGTAEEFDAQYPDGYKINGENQITKVEGGYKVGRKTYETYDAAAAAAITDMPGGLVTQLYDTDGDGKAEEVKLWYMCGVVANKITDNGDGTYSVYRGTMGELEPEYAGRLFDSENFAETTGEKIAAERFDPSIEEGDVVVFWYTPDGWNMKRAKEVNGIFMEGEDHHFYQIDDTQYVDAMKYSRDNLFVSNRNGEFANAHKYFGFNANDDGLKVSLWLDPGSLAPVGFTSNENAKTFLASALEQAKAKLDWVTMPAEPTEDQAFSYQALEKAIDLAQTILDDENSTSNQCDYAVYYLYLTLNGTGNDIGASFAGFYKGEGKGPGEGYGMGGYGGFDTYFGLPMATIITKLEGNGMNSTAIDVTSPENAKYFDDNGVNGVVAAGKFSINGFAIPGTAEEFDAQYPDGYKINGENQITKVEGGYKVGKKTYEVYADAAAAAITGMPGGLVTELFDTDDDGYADTVKLWYKCGVFVSEITDNGDGTYSVYRGQMGDLEPEYAGRLFDSENFAETTGEKIAAERFDTSIQVGDVAVFWYTPEGWNMQRAKEVNGIFMEGEDHHFYQIDDTQYTDAMKYSRDNLFVSNRNGEFANAHKYFGFNANDDGLKVSLWLDPGSLAPIGFTSNENAKIFLQRGLEQAKAKYDSVTLPAEPTEDQAFAYQALEKAIALAQTILDDENSVSNQCDYALYYLYLTLNGTGNDIGASFAGFYKGEGKGPGEGYGMGKFGGFDTYFGLN